MTFPEFLWAVDVALVVAVVLGLFVCVIADA